MSGPLYCDREDVYRQAPRGSLTEPARLVAAVDASANTITVNGHALREDDEISFRLGADDGEIIAGLAVGTTYYAEPITESTFKVRAAAGGAEVNLTAEGTNVMLVVSRGPDIDDEIRAASRLFDGAVVGHEVPFAEPIPDEVRLWVAKIAAFNTLDSLGKTTPQMVARNASILEQLKTLAKGVRLRDPEATTQTKIARGRSPSTTTTGAEVVP